MAKNNILNVFIFGNEIGRLGLDENEGTTYFQYHPDFLKKENYRNIFPATGIIKKVPQVQVFNKYNNSTFKGIAPPIADSLPDIFGNLIFKTWLESKNVLEITVLEQLAYVANRGMGALEYKPSKSIPKKTTINLEEIIEVLQSVLDLKKSKQENKINTKALYNIFKIGTSAGGAKPKILISENKNTGKIIPGDLEYSDSYHHYLVKLSLEDELDYPRQLVEYCYYLTAKELGIEMMDSKLIENKHFATQRFDRQKGEKQHVLTASGMTGWDFKSAENSSYENLFSLCSFLKVSHAQIEELFKRMVFNVVFKNTDDHLKNHSFIYNQKKDNWRLAPAYDLTYALNPLLDFKTISRGLSINNKRDKINNNDLLKIGEQFTIKNPKGIISEVQEAIPLLSKNMNDQQVPKKISDSILKRLGPKI